MSPSIVPDLEDNPPNAELAIYDKKGDKHAVFILSRPEVKGDTISFKVRLIGDSIPKSFGHSTLFVDPDTLYKSLTPLSPHLKRFLFP